MEGIASRLEALAIKLEAIATRLEAIAIKLGASNIPQRPSLAVAPLPRGLRLFGRFLRGFLGLLLHLGTHLFTAVPEGLEW